MSRNLLPCMLGFLLMLLFREPLRAQGSQLQPGDIAIIAFQSDNNDQFAFVCLVDMQAGTKILFSEKGWDGSLATPAFAVTTEGVHTWTAPASGISRGTVVTVEFNSVGLSPVASVGSISSSAAAKFSTSGDQLLAYQGSASAPVFIYGFASRSWINTGTPTSTQSWLPPNLVNGISARDFATESDDQYFKITGNTGSKQMMLTAIGNVSNWSRSNTRYASLPAWSFNLSTHYYSKSVGLITDLNTWGTAPDGSGTAPGSFTDAGMTYHLTNRSGTHLMESNWTIGKLYLEKDLHLGLNNYQLSVEDIDAASEGLLEGTIGSQLVITGNSGPISFSPDKAVLKSLSLLSYASASLNQPLQICGGSNSGFVAMSDHSLLHTNGLLTLAADETGSAGIKPMGNQAVLDGAVEVQLYIPGGRRNFRFMGHPFAQTIGLNKLTADIDITGAGGSSNGFTNTATNNPSAFYYDPLLGDGSATDAGWIPFTNTNGLQENAWSPMQGIRINIRGKKGEGLNGAAYTPSAAMLHVKGSINTGDQTILLKKNSSNPGFNLIGNPFPAAIDMSKLMAGTSVAPSYYVWDPHQGTRGGYSCYLFSNPMILPAFASFFVQTSNGISGNTLLIPESAKSFGISPIRLMGAGKDVSDQLELSLSSDSIFWDRQLFLFNDSATDQMDAMDAKKMINPDLNFYSLSAEKEMLSIDCRRKEIPMNIPVFVDTKLEKTILMSAMQLPSFKDVKLYLLDKVAHQTILIDSGFRYSFQTGPTYPADRFELQIKPSVANMSVPPSAHLSVKVFPNPIKEKLTLSISSPTGNTILLILYNANGQLIRSENIGLPENATAHTMFDMDCKNLSSGVYFLSVWDGAEKQIQKIIKP